MNDDYYLSHGPLHEHNRILPEPTSSTTNYLSYSLPEFHTEKQSKKVNGKSHHRTISTSTKTKTQITEKEAKDAIMKGLVTETNDVDISKLSGNNKFQRFYFCYTDCILFN